MKYALIFFLVSFSDYAFGQRYQAKIDTISLNSFSLKKIVLLKQNGACIGVSYSDFMNTIKRIKKSQLKDSRKNYRSAIKEIRAAAQKSDTIFLSESEIGKLHTVTVYKYFANKVNAGNAIILDDKNFLQKKIIRKKISNNNGMLQGGQASEYYFIDSKDFFFKVNDWTS
jgi:hypothetical protein